MKTEKIIKALALTRLAGDIPEEFNGVYTGDFLSRAMSRIDGGNLWITVMSNVNVIAVASLTDCSAVILSEGVTLPDEAIAAANDKKICVFSSNMSSYELCAELSRLSGEENGQV